MTAEEAKEYGIVDGVVEKNNINQAREYAYSLAWFLIFNPFIN